VALEAVCEREAAQLATGLPHDRYLFQCGVLYALRRAYSLSNDIVTATNNLEEMTNARSRSAAVAEQRRANTFLNTPWWDGYQSDAANAAR
jgi:hypothetical protein